MPSHVWPEALKELVFFPHMDEKLDDLAKLAESEDWDYQHTESDFNKPILYNCLRYTYSRLAVENKITVSDDGQFIALNTGLVTDHQEPIYLVANQNRFPNAEQPWHFQNWCRKGQYDMTRFSQLPEMAHYFDDPTALVLDLRRELRVNVEHIIEEILLPLCISNPVKADLAMVVEDHSAFYRASTRLTLDMAYNNARQLARPDRATG